MTDAYEPRQVREEAAVSKKVCVVTESISDLPVGRTSRSWFEEGCTAKDSSDAQVTNVSGQALMVKLADCQGVVLYDPERNVVGVVHCGWRGN